MHNVLGGYTIGDVNVVAAFDVDKEKVGVDINEAIFAKTNNALPFHDVPRSGDYGGPWDDARRYRAVSRRRGGEGAGGLRRDIVGILREREVDVVINYLPVGSEQATKWYVEQVLGGGLRVRELHTGVYCEPAVLAEAVRGQGRTGCGR